MLDNASFTKDKKTNKDNIKSSPIYRTISVRTKQ